MKYLICILGGGYLMTLIQPEFGYIIGGIVCILFGILNGIIFY